MRDGVDVRHGSRRGTLLGLIGVVAILALGAVPARAADDAWGDDTRWISIRAGSARSGAHFAGEGGFGYGFGYTWFLAKELAWSANVQHDMLGHFGGSAEIEVPFTVEFTKHMGFSATARPYLGVGWGAVYHKLYRTGFDTSGFRQAGHLALGLNALVTPASLIGADVRIMLEQDTRSINPTFPNVDPSTVNWSVKLSYSRVL